MVVSLSSGGELLGSAFAVLKYLVLATKIGKGTDPQMISHILTPTPRFLCFCTTQDTTLSRGPAATCEFFILGCTPAKLHAEKSRHMGC